ncbi:MAG: hypothetical protein ACREOS_01805 [Candidatus Dormibacteraceae bacterium]
MRVWAWGLNDKGELGDGNTTNSASPVQVSGLSNVTAIGGGGYHGLAITPPPTPTATPIPTATDTPTPTSYHLYLPDVFG